MAGNFNLADFKTNEYLKTLYDPTKLYTVAEQNMEQQDINRANEAIGKPFLSLTLKEKLEELGVGERVMEQIADTAKGMVTGIFEDIVDYIDKYQNIFDQERYNQEIQSYARQLYFNNKELHAAAMAQATGTNFVYNM